MKKNKKLNIAIFGGSFDPPHIGHIKIVKKALEKLPIDKLFVVPTHLNPFKKDFFADGKLRYKWLKKIFQDNKKVKVCDYEIKQKRAVATIETVRYLLENYDISQIYLIIGADNLSSLEKWKEYETLKKLVTFVVASRDDIALPKNLINLEISANISSTKLRESMDERYLPTSVKHEIIKFYKERDEQKDR
jgi:nicotinate-nucleotide adenylyltransferase